jgi:GH18 family chitinase
MCITLSATSPAVTASGWNGSFSDCLDGTTYKRIASFGGWAFSTDADTYDVFREGVTEANRATLIDNLVSFVNQYDVDGVDFDWEYPGEPDIPDIPAGNDDDGDNYLAFLTDLKAALPDDITVSIAAPASYWYLKQFPIANISEVVDYIIYMTYDLHGQWDYGNDYADPGCSDGNCLRSHVNLTETKQSLAMITKAGVQANKVVVGVASYGRSFEMTDSSCHTPDCTFTGPDSGATPGNCTATAGYISNVELAEILANSSYSATSYTDDDSDSNVIMYNGNWVAFMNDTIKARRTTYYTGLNFAGTSDWAIDLQEVSSDDDGDGIGTGIVGHELGDGHTSCDDLPDSPSGDAVNTFIWNFHSVACNDMTATMTTTGMPFATMDCTAPAVTNADQDQSDRWDDVYTDSAFEIVILDYFYQSAKTLITFPEYVSNFFNGPEGMNCGKTAADSGCDTVSECDDVNYPAGYFLLNSFVAIHGVSIFPL